jgi:hypothetical protein
MEAALLVAFIVSVEIGFYYACRYFREKKP